MPGSGHYAPESGSGQTSLVKTPTLSALLLSAGELGRTLGAPALKQGTMFDSMESMSTLTLSELRCSPVIFGVFDEQYRGSGSNEFSRMATLWSLILDRCRINSRD